MDLTKVVGLVEGIDMQKFVRQIGMKIKMYSVILTNELLLCSPSLSTALTEKHGKVIKWPDWKVERKKGREGG